MLFEFTHVADFVNVLFATPVSLSVRKSCSQNNVAAATDAVPSADLTSLCENCI